MSLSPEQIDVLTTHLPYELDQLDASYIYAGNPVSDRRDRLGQLIAIDCFYLHARSLIEFYARRPSQQDSRTAAAWEFTEAPLDYPSDGSKYEALINDQVAHLNYARGRHSKEPLSGPSMIEIHRVLEASFYKFQANLTAQSKKHWTGRQPRVINVTEGNQNSACNEIYMSVSGYMAEWTEKDGNLIYIIR